MAQYRNENRELELEESERPPLAMGPAGTEDPVFWIGTEMLIAVNKLMRVNIVVDGGSQTLF